MSSLYVLMRHNDYRATLQHSTSKSGGCQLDSCEFVGHRPHFRLLVEESVKSSHQSSVDSSQFSVLGLRFLLTQ
jgi:hypothetical protein